MKRRLLSVTALFLCGLALPTQYVDAASYLVSDTAEAHGLAATNETWTATLVDYNADGIEDVWVGYHDQGAKLYRGLGAGQFVTDAVTASAWPRRQLPSADFPKPAVIDRHDCSFGQFTQQTGPLDVYCANGRTLENVAKTGDRDNELWVQQADGSFVDIGTAQGLGDPYGRGRGVLVLDANNDGWDDIYVTNALPRDGILTAESSQ